MINIKCPVCGITKRIKERKSGQQVFCSLKCKKLFRDVTITEMFRDRIRLYMEQRGFKQWMMALCCDVGTNTINRLLSGKEDIFDLYTIDKICCAIRQPLLWLEVNGELINKYTLEQ